MFIQVLSECIIVYSYLKKADVPPDHYRGCSQSELRDERRVHLFHNQQLMKRNAASSFLTATLDPNRVNKILNQV